MNREARERKGRTPPRKNPPLPPPRKNPPCPPQGGKEEDAILTSCSLRLRGLIIPMQPDTT
ncbi:hypothetical protein [Microcoleus sp.]|uniref:hypothetical protein n=1 Tax=Microcoleus sp. TaxID=44472 RepID=UPI00352542B6